MAHALHAVTECYVQIRHMKGEVHATTPAHCSVQAEVFKDFLKICYVCCGAPLVLSTGAACTQMYETRELK